MQKPPFSIELALNNLRIDELNEIQKASLEANKQSDNIVLLADTGSGKTLAFLLPIAQVLDNNKKLCQALIIVPSRELALQIEQVFKKMGTGFKITCCYGGHLRETEENNLKQAPALIVGTPGRLADHIRRGNIDTSAIETLVLDEFDKSLEEGFDEEMSNIIAALPALKKRILTSATVAVEVPEFVGLKNPVEINFLTGEKSAALEVKMVHSDEKDKSETLFRLICALGNRSTVIFCNQREFVEQVNSSLKDRGIVSVFYHGAMEQQERDNALCRFRNGSSNVLVTTDLAARGLDVPNIRYVIHYQLPTSQDIYTHRNGRTARMDASGTAILILAPGERIPEYIVPAPTEIELPETAVIPQKPVWTTLFIAAGKKDKVNKVDIVGFFTNKGQLKKEDIGLIEVKDFFSFVAVRKSRASHTLQLIKDQKIKGKKVKIDIAK
ncbi:DEAD/DEAH box helicase [Pseudoflavitalea sp. G-6-1-2]|uniref:DEAD/DEAH box helicase n=1 Tax=Pseudoflavitalea sp. G-6-1-2 TaxID=2728841 RepID=UPI00146F623D|nr:DEAD/DEAH box helicase [Pseudoflavitalea sp. G-6-1-2]NML23089.1 DEAD/DEAH box helicase [Pseudoflavitalea sp. G-6-1-2]